MAAGLVLLVVRPEKSIIALILITIAAVLRIRDLRRGRLRFAPRPLTVIALLMPLSVARSYLEEFARNATEVHGREARRHVWNAVVESPATLVTVWHDWFRTKLVRLTARLLSSRVDRVRLVIRDLAAAPGRHEAALRRLQRYCRLILLATGSGQFHDYAGPAEALLRSCRQSAENGGDAELTTRIQKDVDRLVCALASRRPDRA
ncbi:hypothetical protein [Actinophytocola oryzae]|uniref:hypothetical protein n=1 Tax=Actinophytocola oryzae TaxID=502181 RepID=UPI0010627EA3|nr:hypothetical protein [Actinophytocola oryzae]